MPDDTSSTSTPGDGPTGDATTTTATQPQTHTGPTHGPTHGPNLADIEADRDKWKTLSRSHEQKWQRATGEAEQAKHLATEREVALNDARAEAARTLAVAQLEARLARAGMPEDAAANYVKFLDAGRLVKDGQPNPDAIAQLVADLPAALRTGPPDPDQGRSSNNQPHDMNQLIRRAAGIA